MSRDVEDKIRGKTVFIFNVIAVVEEVSDYLSAQLLSLSGCLSSPSAGRVRIYLSENRRISRVQKQKDEEGRVG